MPNASNVAAVEAIKGRLEGSVAALLTEYRGLNVKDLGELRASLRGAGTEYKVLKNTLTGIAARQAGYEDLVALLTGPTAVAFVHGDPVEAAKHLADFARTHPALVVKGGVLDGKVLDADEVRRLATLESREVLLARLAGLLQASLTQAVQLFAAPLRQVATMTAALRDQREEAAGPVEEEASGAPEPEGAAPTDGPAAGADQPAPAAPEPGAAEPPSDAAATQAPAGGADASPTTGDRPAGSAESE